MYSPWKIGDKEGNYWFPKGEVVYQTKGVVIEPVYGTNDGKWYIHTENGLKEVLLNPFNDYFYRQDGL